MSDPELRHLQDVVIELYHKLDEVRVRERALHQAIERHKVMRMSSKQRVSSEDKELWDHLRQTPQ